MMVNQGAIIQRYESAELLFLEKESWKEIEIAWSHVMQLCVKSLPGGRGVETVKLF